MSIGDNVKVIRENIAAAAIKAGRAPEEITLVAASKMNDAQRVRAAISAGVDACGENRVQELFEKLGQDAYQGAPLHFIGHLQKNKVKNIVGVATLIQSADSPALIRLIDAQAQKLNIIQDILLEVNIGGEDSKTGLEPAFLDAALETVANLTNIRVQGLMTIPPFTADTVKNRAFFATMRQLYVDIGAKKYNNVNMNILSMGMSSDYEDAILEGASMVRVGSAIFGDRHYTI